MEKEDINNMDFEAYLDNALKSLGYLFPETDEQMAIFEENNKNIQLPKEFESADFVFRGKRRNIFKGNQLCIDNTVGEGNWAIAARDGKDIPEDVLEKMRKDKEEAKKKQNGNK